MQKARAGGGVAKRADGQCRHSRIRPSLSGYSLAMVNCPYQPFDQVNGSRGERRRQTAIRPEGGNARGHRGYAGTAVDARRGVISSFEVVGEREGLVDSNERLYGRGRLWQDWLRLLSIARCRLTRRIRQVLASKSWVSYSARLDVVNASSFRCGCQCLGEDKTTGMGDIKPGV